MWFSARLLYECIVDDGADEPSLKEQSIRLIAAESESAAEVSAKEVGTQAEHEYYNHEGALVRWQFVRVIEIQELYESTLEHGVEVYYRWYETQKPEVGDFELEKDEQS